MLYELTICVVFLFPRPLSCDIMPLQNDMFPSKGMFVLNTAFVGRQLDFLSLPPCKKRYGKILFPCWCSSEIFQIVSENLKFSDFSEFFRFFSENLKFQNFSDFFWKSEIFRFFWIFQIFSENVVLYLNLDLNKNLKFSVFFWFFQIFLKQEYVKLDNH